MQLLYCRPTSTAEFASLSLLVKSESSESTLGEALTVTSTCTTLAPSLATSCINELHEYVNSVYKISLSNKEMSPSNKKSENVSEQLLLDDLSLLGGDPVRVFHPLQGHGIGLHYAVITENRLVQKYASVVLQHAPKTSVESVVAIILSVGVSGLSYASGAMTRRMRDVMGVMEGLKSDLADSQASIKSMLSTMLLTDDEERKTNAMVDLESVALMSDMDGDAPSDKIKNAMSPIGAVRKTKRGQGKRASMLKGDATGSSDIRLMVTASSTADTARIAAEKVAILSVADAESQLRKYEATGLQRRSSMKFGKSKARPRRRRARDDADLEDFDCPALPDTKPQSVPALRPPGVDTASQMNIARPNKPSRASPKKSALPTLMAPRNDVASRRASQHAAKRWMTASSSGPRGGTEISPGTLSLMQPPTTQRDAFNAFANEPSGNNAQTNGTFPGPQFGGASDERAMRTTPSNSVPLNGGDAWGMITSAQTTEFNTPETANDVIPRFDLADTMASNNVSNNNGRRASSSMLPPNNDARRASSSMLSPDSPSRRRASLGEDKKKARDDAVSNLQRLLLASEQNDIHDDDVSHDSRRSSSSYQNGEWTPTMNAELRSAYSELDELVAKVTPAENSEPSVDDMRPRMMINVALNEDLTCSYRQSKMSSCSIEGVVQVQVTSDARDGVPFFLLVRDPSRHIKVVQENRRYADDMTEGILSDNPDDAGVDYKYTVSVPSADDYFPVMRYKCSTELRPVPIRVQTRVRLNEPASCRVALQISSNPANEDDLTDLTIVMGVPLQVKGETLVTTPPGGVWNAAKRSVIWCVAELGDGEKFQLQAEFEMSPDASPLPPGSKPKFPVLVRCQCMYAQLSDVELEVSDISDVYPADVAMKLARRFRLSHRERS